MGKGQRAAAITMGLGLLLLDLNDSDMTFLPTFTVVKGIAYEVCGPMPPTK